MKVLVINGVNLNMLGIREPEIYGEKSYSALKKYIVAGAKKAGLKCRVVQSNYEGKIVEFIQKAYGRFDGIIINAGAYTHTSIAIADALRAVSLPVVEVHLSDINSREEFRKKSFISPVAEKVVVGKGFAGYAEAIGYFAMRSDPSRLATGDCV